MLHESAWLYMHSYCHQMITQQQQPTTAQGSPCFVDGHSKTTIFQPTHTGLKAGKPSPVVAP